MKTVTDEGFLKRFCKIDWLGVFLNAGLLSLFGVAFIIAGITWEWSDGRTIALLVVFGLEISNHFLFHANICQGISTTSNHPAEVLFVHDCSNSPLPSELSLEIPYSVTSESHDTLHSFQHFLAALLYATLLPICSRR